MLACVSCRKLALMLLELVLLFKPSTLNTWLKVIDKHHGEGLFSLTIIVKLTYLPTIEVNYVKCFSPTMVCVS